MLRLLPVLLLLLPIAACGGVVWDTTVADSPDVRRAMVESVRIGQTTDDEFVLRWGPPLQKAREGGRVDFIYRRQKQSADFVIVTFDYGVASGVRSTETEACRASFAPRVPGYGFDRPDIAMPVGWCGPPTRPGVPLDSVGLGRGDLPK
jgi:hypothetical protein